jgi:hypothetical protein
MGGLQKRFCTLYVTQLRGFNPAQIAACTLVFEGDEAEVRQQEKPVYALARSYGGMAARTASAATSSPSASPIFGIFV